MFVQVLDGIRELHEYAHAIRKLRPWPLVRIREWSLIEQGTGAGGLAVALWCRLFFGMAHGNPPFLDHVTYSAAAGAVVVAGEGSRNGNGIRLGRRAGEGKPPGAPQSALLARF